MKKTTKRVLSLTLMLALLLSVSALFSGCYIVNSEKMKKIEGTYELTSYSGEGDYIASNEMKLYVVIRSDGTGYYAYKDKNTEPHIAELRCSFEADPEESGKYSYVSLDFGNGNGATKLGVQAAGLFEIDTRLGSSTLRWKNVSKPSLGTYTVHVGFTRVSKATDLSYIHENFGEYKVLPHGSLRYEGLYEISGFIISTDLGAFPDDPYIYYFSDIDVIGGTIKTYYMLKSDEKAVEETYEIKIGFDETGRIVIDCDAGKLTADLYATPYSSMLSKEHSSSIKMSLGLIGQYTEEEIVILCEDEYSRYLASLDTSTQ